MIGSCRTTFGDVLRGDPVLARLQLGELGRGARQHGQRGDVERRHPFLHAHRVHDPSIVVLSTRASLSLDVPCYMRQT